MLDALSGSRRCLGACIAAAALALTGCDEALPTAAEVEEMDAAAAEARVQQLGGGGDVTYFINGEEVAEDRARELTPDQIERIEIRSVAGTPAQEIHLYVGEDLTAASDEPAVEDETERVAHATVRFRIRGTSDIDSNPPLILIDGMEAEDFPDQLRPEDIERIEVIKGPAATRLYSHPNAANGVILITTKDPSR